MLRGRHVWDNTHINSGYGKIDGGRTRNAISEEEEQWGGCKVPVREDCLGLVVPESTAEISNPELEG
jgi:hypothetical protein